MEESAALQGGARSASSCFKAGTAVPVVHSSPTFGYFGGGSVLFIGSSDSSFALKDHW